MGPRPLIAGNWKMFGRRADLEEIDAIAAAAAPDGLDVDVLLCPPVTLLAAAADRTRGTRLKIGGQDCCAGPDGARTGDINAQMLADAGAAHCILGHSERRHGHGETDDVVLEKVRAVAAAGLAPIVCVGETLAERQSGLALDVVARQIGASLPESANATFVLAYEPVWAIGTGLTPSLAEIGEMHSAIRSLLGARFGAAGQGMRVLYGGSVKPGNATDIFRVDGVDGALVGAASLKATDFAAIVSAHPAAGRR